MGEPQNRHFYDFGIFGRVQTLQNQLFSSLETPRYLKKSRNNTGTLQKHDFRNLKVLEFHVFS